MGLFLRPDAYPAETPDGMHLLTHEGASSFTGRTAYHLLDRLAPLLNGEHDLDELTAGLDPARRSAVTKLVTGLLERGVLREVDGAPPAHPAGHEAALFDYFLPSGAAAFDAHRARVALVLAAEPWRTAIVTAAERAGLRGTRVIDPYDDVAGELAGVDQVLHAFDGSATPRALALDLLCAERGIPVAHLMHLGDHAWIGHTRPAERGGWSSGWLRLRAHGGQVAGPVPPSRLAATVIAGQLVRGTAAPAAAHADRMTRVDLSTVASESAGFLPHPFAGPVRRVEFRARIAELRDGERLTDVEFSRRAVAGRGDRLGVFTSPTERDLTQIPLHVCEVDVSDPVGLRGAPARVTGAGLDFAAARYLAARRALAVYAWSMLDPRRLTPAGEPLPVDPFEALAALRAGTAVGLTHGHSLIDGEPRTVDAAGVFASPATAANRWLPVGVGAGYDWTEAITEGLLAHSLRVTVEEIPRATAPFPRVDPTALDLGAAGGRYAELLNALGRPVRVYDITGSLGVPTALCCLGDVPAGCASALDLAAATTAAQFQALLRHQSEENGQPEYTPPPAPDLPADLRGQAGGHPITDSCSVRDAAAAFASRGVAPVAVPLDHDDEVFSVLPYIARVVLLDA